MSNNIKPVLTREPGGCDEAELIRNLLVKGSIDKWDSVTEALLHNAARREHVKKIIKPSLLKNKIVICDRFTDSTMAYQVYGKKVNKKFIENIHRHILGGIKPNLTRILKVDHNEASKRLRKRKLLNRYDKFPKNHKKNLIRFFKNKTFKQRSDALEAEELEVVRRLRNE